jgi:alanyl-tRNA synthetase
MHDLKTTKLYWQRPYDTKFSSKIAEVWQEEEGRLFMVLDATLFYPEGGGQPWDCGLITPALCATKGCLHITGILPDGAACNVDYVFEEHGQIIHVLPMDEKSWPVFFKKGQEVYGEIDWERRFDFMQQHTGQHILSRAFEEICNANTVGFHLGKDYVSIDLGLASIDGPCINAVEDLANEIIFKNLPVTVEEYDQEHVPPRIRRRIPTESGTVRIINVGDFDACACGGTHVCSTGEIGIIKINQLDRSHGRVRVIFRCGKRAFLDLREKEKVLGDATRALSVGYQDLLQVVTSLSAKVTGLEKESGRLKKELLEYEIESLARELCSMDTDKGKNFAVRQCEGKQPAELRFMARSISDIAGKMVVLFSMDPRFSLVAASPSPGNEGVENGHGNRAGDADRLSRASGLPPSGNASLLVSKLAKEWGLKGGGTPDLAQMGSKIPLSKSGKDILKDITAVIEDMK